MKKIIIIIIVFSASINLNAQELLATFSTQIEAGVIGKTSNFLPHIEFRALDGSSSTNSTLFDEVLPLGTQDSVTLMISSNEDDANFSNFIALLTTSDDNLLKIGHVVNGVKSHMARPVSAWDENHKLIDASISQVVITYEKIYFKNFEKNINANQNWTDFSYKVSINVYGTASSKTLVLR